MQNKKIQTSKNKFIKTIVIAALIMTSWTPSLNASSDMGTDAAVAMGKAIAGAIIGKAVSKYLFPPEGVDYEKIRIIVEKAIHKAIVQGEISMVEGELKTLNDYVYTTMYSKGMPPLERYKELKLHALKIGRLVNRVSGDYFGEESIGTYIPGAQVELAVIASMYFFAKEAKDEGEMNYAEMLFDRRLVRHYGQMDYVIKVMKDLRSARYHNMGCHNYTSYKWWLMDNWDGVQVMRNWYPTFVECRDAGYIYKRDVMRKYDAFLESTPQFGWMIDIKKTWFDLGVARGILYN